MSIEKNLKDVILSRYGSIREFTMKINMPYSTFDTIMRRGIQKATVSNVIQICEGLQISADALAAGNIIPILEYTKDTRPVSVEQIIDETIHELISTPGLTLDGKPANAEILTQIITAIKIGVELGKRKSDTR